MAFLATAVVLWLQSSYNDPMPAPKVPTTEFHPTCSIPLYSILERTLPDVGESELHISLFEKMLFVMKLPLYNTYLPHFQPNLQSKHCLSWDSCNAK